MIKKNHLKLADYIHLIKYNNTELIDAAKSRDTGVYIKRKALIHFVDLAGSERGAAQFNNSILQGGVSERDIDRARESCKINNSLVV